MPEDTRNTERRGPLVGYRVLDLGVLFAGPLVGALLADYGADVIKVERPDGDPTRNFGMGASKGLHWKYVGRNKRTVAVDLRTEAGQELVRTLAGKADVVVENFRPGTMESWGLGWDDLRSINRRLVMARISGFGQTGPYRDRPGFGTLAEALSGFASINGYPDGPPTVAPIPLGDTIAAMAATVAVLSALLWRDTVSLEGQVIDVSLMEPMFHLVAARLLPQQFEDASGRWGNMSPGVAPKNTYQCRDGQWVVISGSSDEVVRRLFRAIERPELASDPRFATNAARLEHRAALDAILQAWTRARTRAEVIGICQRASATVAPILDFEDVLVDEHVLERDAFVRVPDGDSTLLLPNVIARLGLTPGAVRHAGRGIGEDGQAAIESWLSGRSM